MNECGCYCLLFTARGLQLTACGIYIVGVTVDCFAFAFQCVTVDCMGVTVDSMRVLQLAVEGNHRKTTGRPHAQPLES